MNNIHLLVVPDVVSAVVENVGNVGVNVSGVVDSKGVVVAGVIIGWQAAQHLFSG